LNLLLFYLLAAVIVISGIMVVTLRNVFHSALMLVLTFFTVAGIYLMLNAEFLAAVQVLIYVGAITILILFAIMLTYQIQSKSIRQTNEQVLPAALISLVFLSLAIFAMTKSFGDIKEPKNNTGAWLASVDVNRLPDREKIWDWTLSLEDKSGVNYIAGGNLGIVPELPPNETRNDIFGESDNPEGYILSADPGFSTKNMLFKEGQTIYIKAWKNGLNYNAVIDASLKIVSHEDTSKYVVLPLSNSNTETVGRLMMSKFALPFEIVSVLLLAALMGAIVIARKDR
jgi:NADH:ubiquinone oxidoreductase subunit 6 (subunit J)